MTEENSTETSESKTTETNESKTEGTKDTNELSRKLQEYEDRVQKMDAKIAELLDEKKAEQEKRRKAAQKAAEKDGDIEALRKSFDEEKAKLQEEFSGQLSQANNWVREMTVDSAAMKMASELAIEGSAELLLPQIQRRLGVEVRDDRPTVVVLDENGKPSAKSLEDLGKEIAAKPANAPIIVASRSTGGGAKGGQSTGGAGRRGGDPSKMTVAEKSAYISEHGLAAWNQLIQSNSTASRRT